MTRRPETLGYLSLLLVYLFWGSTFFGIRVAVETIPPLVAGLGRHGFGGLALALGLLISGRWASPSRQELFGALAVGATTAGISNGALMWAEASVPSAYAAIAFTTMPLFMLLFNRFGFERVRPSGYDWAALPLGLLGAGLVVGTGDALGGGAIGAFDIFLLLLCPSVWAFGSLLGRRLRMPPDILVSASLQMLGGASLVGLVSLFHGDWFGLSTATISARSWVGLAYLVVGGSLIGYTAFAVAIRTLDSRVVGTYAFVNPVVAITLGVLAGEQVLRAPIVIGSALAISGAVLTFVGARFRRRP